MSEIQIQATGHLTAEPETTFTPSGQQVTKFRVAVTPRKRQPTGEWVDGETTFLPCEAWGDLGEHTAESLARGDQVIVSGVLRTQRWKDGQGNDRERLFVRVDEVGPSLRYATALPRKVDRREGGLPSATRVTGTSGGSPASGVDAPF